MLINIKLTNTIDILFCRRRYSAPAVLVHDDDDFLMIYEDFNTAMEEVCLMINDNFHAIGQPQMFTATVFTIVFFKLLVSLKKSFVDNHYQCFLKLLNI